MLKRIKGMSFRQDLFDIHAGWFYDSPMKIKTVPLKLLPVIALLVLWGCQGHLSTVVTHYPVPEKDYTRPLRPGDLALRKITDPAKIPDYTKACSDTDNLLEAIDRSLSYMAKPSSGQFYPYGGITHEQAVKSLQELRKLFTSGLTPQQLNTVLREKFDTYMSVGCDDQGTVLFTGYYTPIFEGSPLRSDFFRYPLYRVPDDLVKGPDGKILGQQGKDGQIRPYPDREEIQRTRMLEGYELVWLGDPFEVYIVHVQGSAKIRMPDGHIETIAYAANNGREYKSIRHKLIADGKFTEKNINMKAMIDYFNVRPDEVDMYVNENPRFIFFRKDDSNPRGSLNEPVTPMRTIATDKAIYPRAMFAFADVNLEGDVGFVLDQDTGGAIRAAGRCDVYIGVGDQAGELAGRTYREGRLYYLFVKPEAQTEAAAPAQADKSELP
jgi:membrane-bound lytic murein transglycosylase A